MRFAFFARSIVDYQKIHILASVQRILTKGLSQGRQFFTMDKDTNDLTADMVGIRMVNVYHCHKISMARRYHRHRDVMHTNQSALPPQSPYGVNRFLENPKYGQYPPPQSTVLRRNMSHDVYIVNIRPWMRAGCDKHAFHGNITWVIRPKIASFRTGSRSQSYTWFVGSTRVSPYSSKWHHYWFNCFCRVHERDQQTDRSTTVLLV